MILRGQFSVEFNCAAILSFKDSMTKDFQNEYAYMVCVGVYRGSYSLSTVFYSLD